MHDIVPLHDLPLFLQQAFITAEDKHFYEHSGVDWPARVRAHRADARCPGRCFLQRYQEHRFACRFGDSSPTSGAADLEPS